jgi:hypothetical protein
MISIEALRRYAPPDPATSRSLRSEVRALDALLGAQGVQSGRLTEWIGAPSCGKTGLLRELVRGVRRQGVSVAWIDAGAELLATDWAESAPGRLWVVRPPRRREAAFCAEHLLSTASFGLVVLDGAPPLERSRSVRLQRLARHAGAALVVLGANTTGARVHRRFAFSALTGAPPPPAAMEAESAAPAPRSPSAHRHWPSLVSSPTPLQRALAHRAPLIWRVSGVEGRGGRGDARELILAEVASSRLIAAPSPPDRPSTRRLSSGGGRGRRR